MPQDGTRTETSGALIGLIGGVLVITGSLLVWVKVAVNMPGVGSKSYSLSGMDAANGKTTLALGCLAAAVGLAAMLVKGKARLGAGLAIVELAAGGFAAVLGVMFALDLTTNAVDAVIQQSGLDPDKFSEAARKVLNDALAASAGWGLYLVILGGAVAFIGGVLAAVSMRRSMFEPSSSGDSQAQVSLPGEPEE